MQQLHLLTMAGAMAVAVGVTAFLPTLQRKPNSPVIEEFAGYYYHALKASNFYPCKFDEAWNISSKNPTLARAYRRITGIQHESEANITPIYVELSGIRSELGRYGRLRLSDRSLRVLDVSVTERVLDSDRRCKPASEYGPLVVIEYD